LKHDDETTTDLPTRCAVTSPTILQSEFIQHADERLEAIDDLAQDIQQAIEDWLRANGPGAC
jgi:hypothetical protein